MTQDGGIDVLIAWCTFGALLLLLAWTVLRHHEDPRELSRRSRQDAQSPGPSGAQPQRGGDAPSGEEGSSETVTREGGSS
ncbi:MAG TPA: hypothetical protein VFJ12_08310 [Segeticoccus sp.]|nr:hypothetical protein [Segeticoccus sp.]